MPAVARARAMVAEGADLIDIGGESTRPGAVEVPPEVEIARVRPVIAALAREATGVPISLDTRKSAVGRGGAGAGARSSTMSRGCGSTRLLADVAAETGAPLILMHSIGTPETMQGWRRTAPMSTCFSTSTTRWRRR
jgi:dihydropteroate synthase